MRRRSGWLAIAGSALVLSGCGSSSGSGNSALPIAGSSPTAAAATATVAPPSATAASATVAPSVASAASPAGASAIDPCSLVTQEEATTALGVATQSAVKTAAGPSTTCLYQPPKGYGSVTVTVLPGGAAQIASVRDATSKDLTGIGDEAVLVQGGVWIRKGSTIIAIIILTTDAIAGSPAAVETLARAAGGRL